SCGSRTSVPKHAPKRNIRRLHWYKADAIAPAESKNGKGTRPFPVFPFQPIAAAKLSLLPHNAAAAHTGLAADGALQPAPGKGMIALHIIPQAGDEQRPAVRALVVARPDI